MDLTWALMVRTTWEANLSNSANVKLIKVLNNCACVVHIVPKTSWTPIVELTYRPFPSSISCELNKSLVVEAIVAINWKMIKSSWSMFSKISSSLEDEVKSSLFEELEDKNKKWWKQEERKEGRPLPYIVHMGILIHIWNTNPTLDLNHTLQKYKPSL